MDDFQPVEKQLQKEKADILQNPCLVILVVEKRNGNKVNIRISTKLLNLIKFKKMKKKWYLSHLILNPITIEIL